MTITRGQFWFIAGTLLFVVFVFPFAVAFGPGAASWCADQVPTFDAVRAKWGWLPPGVECHISLDDGGMTRFILPWQRPTPAG